jgi:uncharacterized protein with PQ loop repeat
MEWIGYLGAFLLAACGIPEAYKSCKTGNSNGLTLSFLLMWYLGEIITLIYVLYIEDKPLQFNYISNILFITVILYFKFFPKENRNGS